MKPAHFDYLKVRSLDEALEALARDGGDARILAGGQSLVPTMNFRLARPSLLVDINEIADLDHVSAGSDGLRIGALARHCAFHRPVDDTALGSLLAQIVTHIAHYPIRQRGTFAGSLAHADPASEWCLAAVALDAEMTLAKQGAQRQLAAADFFLGIFTTALEEDEMLVEVRVPPLGEGISTGFYEFARRKGDFALGMALAVLEISDGVIETARIAVGGLSDRPRRLAELEAVLSGRPAEPDVLQAAARDAGDMIEPMEDLHAPAAYRRDLAGVVVARALKQAAGLESRSPA